MERPVGSGRAVAPVISTILLVAITVILAAVLATFVLDLGEEVSDPGPNIGETAGRLEVQETTGSFPNFKFTGGIIRITHIAGDPVAVEDMEIVVDATDACGEQARILNLPSEASRFGFDGFADENLRRGDDSFVSKGTSGSTWEIGVLHVTNKNTFEAGEFFEFRITSSECPLESGDEIDVDLVHTPTNSIMITQALQVRE